MSKELIIPEGEEPKSPEAQCLDLLALARIHIESAAETLKNPMHFYDDRARVVRNNLEAVQVGLEELQNEIDDPFLAKTMEATIHCLAEYIKKIDEKYEMPIETLEKPSPLSKKERARRAQQIVEFLLKEKPEK